MDDTALIGIDWGTTYARAFRYDQNGTLIERRHAEIGLSRIASEAWESRFQEHFGDWVHNPPDAPVLLCGMVGSQQGWSEAPYITCPANTDILGANLHRIPKSHCRIVPGVRTGDAADVPDVMRGEETQLVGLDLRDTHLVCLPGTHSKWVQLDHSVITGFQTYLTGELFDVLSHHSILSRTLEEVISSDEAFMRGLDDSEREGGLLHHLFGVRGLRLFDKLSGSAQADYLSGLLIGQEVRSAIAQVTVDQPLTLVGSHELVARYVSALQHFGRTVDVVDGELAASRGLWRIAEQAELIGSC